MSPLKKFLLPTHSPQVHPSAFIATSAIVLGAVHLAPRSSVWFTAVLRGDINHISIGEESNVQDGAVIHVSDSHPAIVGRRVTIGHRAIVHACTVEDDVLIGMGATLLDGCHIGAGSIIAAGALVPKGLQIPPSSLVVGLPARIARPLTPEESAANTALAAKYVEVAKRHRDLGFGISPLNPTSKIDRFHPR